MLPPSFQKSDELSPPSRSALRLGTTSALPTEKGGPTAGLKFTVPVKVSARSSRGILAERRLSARVPTKVVALRFVSPAASPVKLPLSVLAEFVTQTVPLKMREPLNVWLAASLAMLADRRASARTPLARLSAL